MFFLWNPPACPLNFDENMLTAYEPADNTTKHLAFSFYQKGCVPLHTASLDPPLSETIVLFHLNVNVFH